jgi:hypothetical protein
MILKKKKLTLVLVDYQCNKEETVYILLDMLPRLLSGIQENGVGEQRKPQKWGAV